MYVLRNNFFGSPVIIVNEWIFIERKKFKIEDKATIIEYYDMSASVLEEIESHYTGTSTPEQIESYKNHPDWEVRLTMAKLGLLPEHFARDKECFIRQAVAALGLCPDILKYDPDWEVRAELVRQGLCLDHFKNDPDHRVRKVMAEIRVFTYFLKNDPHPSVRAILAENGLYPEHFINDSHEDIRRKAKEHLREFD